MKFRADELPYTQLEALGLTKKDVLSLPPIDLNALLSGRRTDLQRFNNVTLEGFGKIPSLDAKLSLVRNPDNSVSLRTHPINKEAPNIFNLSPNEVRNLVDGQTEMLEKKVQKDNGEKDDMLIQYDPETREFVGKSIKEIIPPREINNIKLTEEQRNEWKRGHEVDIEGENVRVDLRNTMGFAGKVFVFGLDGGITLAVSSLIKASEKRSAEERQLASNKQEAKPGADGSIRTQQTEFEKQNNLKIPEDNNKKWVKIEDTDPTDNVTVADPNRFVLMDKDKVGNKDIISLKEYDTFSADQSQEVSAGKELGLNDEQQSKGRGR